MGGFPYSGASEKDNTLRLWNITTGKAVAVEEVSMPPSNMTGGTSRISVSANGEKAAVFAFVDTRNDVYPSAVYLLDVSNAVISNQFTLTEGEVIGNVVFNRDGSMLVVNFLSSVLFLDAGDGKPIGQLHFEHNLHELALSPDDRWLVVAVEDDNFNKSNILFWSVV
jgi:WD40 repeat protein